jgi:hypothetical protein
VYGPLAMYSSSLVSASPARSTRAVPKVRRMATELSLVSEKSSPGGGAMKSVTAPPTLKVRPTYPPEYYGSCWSSVG